MSGPPQISHQRGEIELGGWRLAGDLLLPAQPRGGVVLAHGKVNDLDHPSLQAAAQGAARQGWAALRFNFPYRQAGRPEPDPFPVLLRCHRAACAWLAEQLPQGAPLVPAGKSQGSRTALALGDELPAAGLILLGYPLHSSRERRSAAPGAPGPPASAPAHHPGASGTPWPGPSCWAPCWPGSPGPCASGRCPRAATASRCPADPCARRRCGGRMAWEVESFLAALSRWWQKGVE